VFNGSASLRSAAGQLIENTCKSARRKEEMSEGYLDKLFKDVTSLYRLDQIDGNQAKRDIPTESKALLMAIAVIWLLIGAWRVRAVLKKRKKT